MYELKLSGIDMLSRRSKDCMVRSFSHAAAAGFVGYSVEFTLRKCMLGRFHYDEHNMQFPWYRNYFRSGIL